MRIVSLLPEATEIVCLLGLADRLVGVSADSDWPPEVVRDLPVLNTVSIDTSTMTSREIDEAANSVGHRGASLYHVDADLLRSLRPDVILTQETCAVCAVTRQDVELATRTLGYRPRVLSLNPVAFDQVFDEIGLVAYTAGLSEHAVDEVVGPLRERISRVRAKAGPLPLPRVFCMEWLDPPYTAGHWVPDMVELAGGRDGLSMAAAPSQRIDWQEVVDYAPQVLVLIPCSLSLERIAAEFPLLRERPGWHSLPAVEASQVYAGHTHLFSQAGPRLVDGVEALARMMHPESFDEPLPEGQVLRISRDGERLEPFR